MILLGRYAVLWVEDLLCVGYMEVGCVLLPRARYSTAA